MGFRHSLFGWERSNFTHYQAAYYKYGGSVNTHPDIINFFMQKKEKISHSGITDAMARSPQRTLPVMKIPSA